MRPHREGGFARWLAIAAGAVLLASCRSVTAPVAILAPAGLAVSVGAETAALPEGAPRDAAESPSDASRRDDAAAPTDGGVRRTGLEAPVSPLPRVALVGHAAAVPVHPTAAPCPDGRCGAGAGPGMAECSGRGCRAGGCGSPRCRLHRHRPAAACPDGQCGSDTCGPVVPVVAVPVIGPCLVCDGGDRGKPALAKGRAELKNVTSGDTVARYRAAGPGPAPTDDACLESDACVVASNCTCVYAPRFSSVRHVTRPFEDSALTGPRGVALDTVLVARTAGRAVRDKTQQLQPVGARRAQSGIAVEDRIPVLAVDKVQPPRLEEAFDGPVAHSLDQPPEGLRNVEAPRLARKVDVPLAWTCVSGAQVTVNGEAADVLAVDHGVATLRLESPGRCELTLCKRAGTDAVRPGDELDFTIYLLNSGDRPLTDITLADAVPGRLEVIDSSPSASLPADVSTAKAEDGSTVITWVFRGTLRPGEGGFVRFRTIVH